MDLDYVCGLRIRLLGDRVRQNVAWKVADQLGWPDTLDAEYVALTQLQADAFITLNRQLAEAVKDLVIVAPIETLSRSHGNPRATLHTDRTQLTQTVRGRVAPAVGQLNLMMVSCGGQSRPRSSDTRNGRTSPSA